MSENKLMQALIKLQDEITRGKVKNQGGQVTRYRLLSNYSAAYRMQSPQMLALAEILVKRMTVGKEYTKDEVFDFIQEDKKDYPVLANSSQDSGRIFQYYAGGRTGFVRDGFLDKYMRKDTRFEAFVKWLRKLITKEVK